MEDLKSLLSDRTRIVAVPHVSNMLGEVLQLDTAVHLIRNGPAGAQFCPLEFINSAVHSNISAPAVSIAAIFLPSTLQWITLGVHEMLEKPLLLMLSYCLYLLQPLLQDVMYRQQTKECGCLYLAGAEINSMLCTDRK